MGLFVGLLKKCELRYRRFWSVPRNPISYVNTVDFPHEPYGASVKNWCQTDRGLRGHPSADLCPHFAYAWMGDGTVWVAARGWIRRAAGTD